jgi:hypothetical protein
MNKGLKIEEVRGTDKAEKPNATSEASA